MFVLVLLGLCFGTFETALLAQEQKAEAGSENFQSGSEPNQGACLAW